MRLRASLRLSVRVRELALGAGVVVAGERKLGHCRPEKRRDRYRHGFGGFLVVLSGGRERCERRLLPRYARLLRVSNLLDWMGGEGCVRAPSWSLPIYVLTAVR